MQQQANFYGLDIETDTRTDPVDPTVAAITTVAISGRSLEREFRGDEVTILSELDDLCEARMINEGAAGTKAAAFKPVWEDFKKTRETEIIPFVYAGKQADANR